MLKFVILLAAIVGALGAAIPEGMLPEIDGRIVDGKPTSVSSFPWQISLQGRGSHRCGGSVYSELHVVTAAHCLQFVTAANVKIRAGSSQWTSGGILVGVKTFKNHPKYNPLISANDIAVIRLESALKFSSTIRPIKLATIAPESGAVGIVSGWGTTKFSSPTIPTQLKYVEMKILSQEDCASSEYKYGIQVRKSMICTYQVGKDSCQGDSGGPLVSNGTLVGVVSWGDGCAFEHRPGVYANVAVLRDWVISTVATI